MTYSALDSEFMAEAIRLAKRGLYTTDPNPRVGCILVKYGIIIGQGWHQLAGLPHAEVNALTQAGDNAKGATAYVTLEPCSHHGKTPPCADALLAAGVSRVVVAMRDPNPLVAGQGLSYLQKNGVQVECGLMEDEAKQLNPGFISRMTRKRPFVRVKLAASLDGRSALNNGESQWITSPEARQDVQYYRSRASAILTGSATVRADDPSLNVRLSSSELGIEGNVRQPLRVVLDSELSLDPEAKFFQLPGKTRIYTTSQLLLKKQIFRQAGVEIIHVESQSTPYDNEQPDEIDNNRLNLHKVLASLASDGMNEVHVEAGEQLCGALLAEQLVDEIILYQAPSLMGSSAKGLFALPELESMQDKIELTITDLRKVGRDIRITATPNY